jgi:CHRD domain
VKTLLGMLCVLTTALCPLAVNGAARVLHTVTLTARLRASRESPPRPPRGSGIATIRLDESKQRVCFSIRVVAIRLPATAAHIHLSGRRRNGPAIMTLRPPNKRGVSQGCLSVPRSQIRAIEDHPAYYYVNVSTSDYPRGAVRGAL